MQNWLKSTIKTIDVRILIQNEESDILSYTSMQSSLFYEVVCVVVIMVIEHQCKAPHQQPLKEQTTRVKVSGNIWIGTLWVSIEATAEKRKSSQFIANQCSYSNTMENNMKTNELVLPLLGSEHVRAQLQ